MGFTVAFQSCVQCVPTKSVINIFLQFVITLQLNPLNSWLLLFSELMNTCLDTANQPTHASVTLGTYAIYIIFI